MRKATQEMLTDEEGFLSMLYLRKAMIELLFTKRDGQYSLEKNPKVYFYSPWK